jgi:PEGA domain
MYPWQTIIESKAFKLSISLLMLLVCLQGGCVRRRMTIRSTPPGAKVYVDDVEIGTTPVSTYFNYYAARKITLIKDGYRTETNYQRILPPWYEVPPLDFFSENLWPKELRDERILDFQLVPQEVVPQEKLLRRAENLRLNARQGILSPLVPEQLLQPEVLPDSPIPHYPGEGLPDN